MITELFIGERRKLIVDYKNVMNVVQAISTVKYGGRKNILSNVELGPCNWSNEPETWFIHFDMTNKQWRKFIDILAKMNHTIILNKDGKMYLT